jgi:mono/diheme cytochrome c family protein
MTAARRRTFVLIGLGVLALAVIAFLVVRFINRDEPELHTSATEHFKYGSIGSEDRAGVPYSLWLVLPEVFPDLLPKGGGDGYRRMGFVYEPGHIRPIGTSYRENPIGQVGLNCAVCHTATVRDGRNAPARIVLGMPANQFNLQAYINFLRATAKDKRFTPDVLIPVMKRRDPDFGFTDELLYRHVVIPRTKRVLREIDQDFAWMDRRPTQGPGRVDTFNPYKAIFDIDRVSDETVGTADLPSLWNQRPRQGMHLHWDGNNTKVEERNISAAIGAGASEESLDEPAMARIAAWIRALPAPRYPRDRIDSDLARQGASVYADRCAVCHSFDGERVGQVTPVAAIGTDRERLDSFTPELVGRMNTLGTGRPWRFRHFRKTDGYANQPLDGVWLRAPYLHNGSVPDLRALLTRPADRPKVFYRGYDVYDWDRVGFVSRGAAARRVGFRYDTSVRGNGNGGHEYGTGLSAGEKRALIEYMKGL